MSNGGLFNIISMLGNLPSPAPDADNNSFENNSTDNNRGPGSSKINSSPLFAKRWSDAQAAHRRNNLTALLSNNEPKLPAGRDPNNGRPLPNNRNSNNESSLTNTLNSGIEHTFSNLRGSNSGSNNGTALTNTPNSNNSNNESTSLNFRDSNNTFSLPNTANSVLPSLEQTRDLINHSWQDLINAASQHQDLENFHQEGPAFWDKVVKISELRTIETYVNGQLEPRVSSRYGELLEILNRQGGAASLESFLNYLPSGEREVFLARYQINQTFGANELFAGRGIAASISGQFPLEVFLSINGKNPQLSINTLLGLLGGDLTASGKAFSFSGQNIFTANFQFLLNSKSAALLGLSLVLYQNINALLSLSELTPEALLPKAAFELPGLPNQTRNKVVFGKSENADGAVDAKRFAGETLVGAALINGASKTAEKYRKTKYTGGTSGSFCNETLSFGFAAGATGAMMGATVGCIVPLAENSVGEILGFAASVVAGLTDSGLRSLGANTLLSLITSGAQSFLDVSAGSRKSLPSSAPGKFLN